MFDLKSIYIFLTLDIWAVNLLLRVQLSHSEPGLNVGQLGAQ